MSENRDLMNDRKREEDDPFAADVVKEYLDARAELAALEERVETLKFRVMDIVLDEPNGKLPSFLGCDITTSVRKTWGYSPNVKKFEKELAALRKMEQANGLARIEKTSVVLTVTRALDDLPPF